MRRRAIAVQSERVYRPQYEQFGIGIQGRARGTVRFVRARELRETARKLGLLR